MSAKIVRIGEIFDRTLLVEAIELLKNNKVVAIPTETVYGLAANALNSDAVDEIFKAKKRPSDNPLIVHISSLPMLFSIVEKPADMSLFDTLISNFWPGPLTLLFTRKCNIPNNVTAGLNTIAVRYPSHPVAVALIESCNFPLAAPSANLSGRPSPTEASHVYDDLHDRIPLIIDGGKSLKGLESTVVDLLSSPPIILRPGSITLEMLRKFVPNIQLYQAQKTIEKDPLLDFGKTLLEHDLSDRPVSPGLKYKHYSPRAVLFVLDCMYYSNITKLKILLSRVTEFCSKKKILGSALLDSSIEPMDLGHTSNSILIDSFSDPSYETIARELFSKLRKLDSYNVSFIIMRSVPEDNEGIAIMNRVLKASYSTISSDEQILDLLSRLF